MPARRPASPPRAPVPVAPRARHTYTPLAPSLRPLYTHAAPVGTRHTPALLLPAHSTATLLTPAVQAPLRAPAPDDHTAAVALSADASLAAHALRSGRVDLLALPGPRLLHSLRPFRDRSVVSHAAFDASATYVALAAADGHVRVFDARSATLTHVFKMPAEGALVCAVCFHPDPAEKALLLGAEDGGVYVADLARKDPHPRLVARHHVTGVVAFAFAQEGRVVVTVAADRLICIARWGELGKARLVATEERMVAAVGGGRDVLYTVGESSMVRVWDIEAGREVANAAVKLPFVRVREDADADQGKGDEDAEEMEEAVLPTGLAWYGEEELVVSLSDQTLLHVPVVGRQVKAVRKVVCGNLEEIYDLRALRTRDAEATVATRGVREFAVASNSACLWIMQMDENGRGGGSVDEGRVDSHDVETQPTDADDGGVWSCREGLPGHSGIILSVDAMTHPKAVGKTNTADTYLATSSRDKTARVWRRSRSTGHWSCMALAEGHTDAVGAVAISQRSASGQFFIVTGAADKTIKLWSLDLAQQNANKLEKNQGVSNESSAQTDGGKKKVENAAVTADTSITALSAKWTMLAHEKDVNAVAISPDVQIIATGSQDRSLKLWDAAKGKLRTTCLGHQRGIWNVAFSTVDRIVASCSGDATVRLWSVTSGTCLRSLQGHSSGVLRCVFMSSGTQIASSGADGLVKIWATRSGECGTTLDAHEDRAWALDAIDDGEYLVTGGADGAARVWRDATEEQALAVVEKKEEEAIMEQAVHNAARAGRWSAAARGALSIGMTQKLRSVLIELITTAECPEEELIKLVRQLAQPSGKVESKKDAWALISRLFLCCRDWNASGGAKNAAVAARVMNALFSVWTPNELCDFLSVDKRALVEALDAHCSRHLARVSASASKASILEHTLNRMRALGTLDETDRKAGGELAVPDSAKPNAVSEPVGGNVVARKRKRREDHAVDY